MPDYRRYRVPGGCYFFTVNLLERRGNTLLNERIDVLREAVRRVRRVRPFIIDAWVVLPDHLHAVWTLPAGDDDFSTRWRMIKTFFARSLRRQNGCPPSEGWQENAASGNVAFGSTRSAAMQIMRHTWTTCIFNPVKHELAAAPAEWPYSTFKSCVGHGLYPLDWIGSSVHDVPAGEPGR